MISQKSLTPSYILHTRLYRETSLLIDLFTLEHGRVSVIARGARRSKSKGIYQPFTALLVSYYGKTELLTLRSVEQAGKSFCLQGAMLFSGLYMNELLIRLLPRFVPHHQSFEAYQIALTSLQDAKSAQQVLRSFEKSLLKDLGYALQLQFDALTGKDFQDDLYYRFEPTVGLLPIAESERCISADSVFRGKSLSALYNDSLQDHASQKDAKRLMRLVFEGLLGSKKINSKELFRSY